MNSMTNKNNILIYDKSQKYIRYISHYCGCNIQAIFCTSLNELFSFDLMTISTVYYCVEKHDDCKFVIKLQKLVNYIYIITDLNIRDKFSDFNNIFFINIKSYPLSMIYHFYQKSIELDKI